MRRTVIYPQFALFLSAVLLTACVAAAQGNRSAQIYGDVIAGPGQSEVIVENTLQVPVKIFINGQLAGMAGGMKAERLVVADGNNYIKVQSTERNGATSREAQFYTYARRFVFKVTSPHITTMSLTNESSYHIAQIRSDAPAAAARSAPAPASTSPQTALERNKSSMMGRLDDQVAKQSAAPAPAPAPRASASHAQPSAGSAPAAQSSKMKIPLAIYVTGNMPDAENKIISTKMLTALTNSGSFIAVERAEEFLAKIDAEHVKQRDESVDEKQIGQLGKQFGARYICVVSALHASTMGVVQLSARIIDVETALVVSIAEDSGPMKSMDDLDALVFKVVRALLK